MSAQRNDDLKQVDEQLFQWACWSKNHGIHLGYPRQCVEHRIRTQGLQGAAVRKEKPTMMHVHMPEAIERTEQAILRLPNQEYMDIVKAKYLHGGTDEDRARYLTKTWSKELKVATYRRMLERAMYWLCGFLHTQYEDIAM